MTSVAADSDATPNAPARGLPASAPYATGGARPSHGTINALFLDAVERFDRPDAVSFKTGGVWQSLSHRTILERVRSAAVYQDNGLAAAPAWIFGAEPETMRGLLETLTATYGSAEQWALAKGLAPEDVDRLRTTLLA